MLIDKTNGDERVAPYSERILVDGTRCWNLFDMRDKWVENGIEEIADPIPGDDNFYYNQPINQPPYLTITPKSVAQIRSMLWERIKAKRDYIIDNGGCLVSGYWFHSDVKSKQQQMALSMVGAGLPVGLRWKTMDGTFATLTQQLVADIFVAQMTREQLIFLTAETMKATIEAASFETLTTFDITAGWPAVYTPA